MRRSFLLAAAAALVSSTVSAEVKWAPYLAAEIYGGQSKFSSGDVNGLNGNLVAVPAMRFGDKFSLLPSLSLAYRKTRDVQELAGGGFLTQEQQTRSVSLKGIYAFTPAWKGKAYAGLRQELINETSDEKWGNGLFDYDKTSFGLEVEREGETWKSVRFGLDMYQTEFPNFNSLSSQSQFGSEINAGDKVLDFDAMDVSLGGDLAVGARGQLSGFLMLSNRDFSDQRLVLSNGSYSADTRQDSFLYGSLGYSRQLPGWALFGVGVESLAGFDVSYASLDSDQNNYDAGRTRFNANYYDYGELGFGPRFNARFKEKLGLGLSYSMSTRDYADRPVQNPDGSYTTETISSDVTTFRASLSYPLVKGLSLRLIGAWQDSDSNMKFQQTYRYDYSSSNYFAGLSYQL